MAFCTTDDEDITKEFYDWYLKEEEFPIEKGLFIMEINKDGANTSYGIEFDLTDPDEVLLDIIVRGSKKKFAQFNFYRNDNLTMKNISVEIDFIQMSEFHKLNNLVWTADDLGKVKMDAHYKAERSKFSTRREGMRKVRPVMYRGASESMCRQAVYCLYATMFYLVKRDPIYTDKSISKVNNKEFDYVLQEYKYTGFVDINKRSVCRVNAVKDIDLPKRDYTRHIGSWTVRGHYRRINGNLVWVKPHIKGQGELEQRVYGTDESQARTVKVFHVFRRKAFSNRATRPPQPNKERQNSLVLSLFRRFINIFKSA